MGVFSKTIIPLALVGYEMIVVDSALRASLAIYHLIIFQANEETFTCDTSKTDVSIKWKLVYSKISFGVEILLFVVRRAIKLPISARAN